MSNSDWADIDAQCELDDWQERGIYNGEHRDQILWLLAVFARSSYDMGFKDGAQQGKIEAEKRGRIAGLREGISTSEELMLEFKELIAQLALKEVKILLRARADELEKQD